MAGLAVAFTVGNREGSVGPPSSGMSSEIPEQAAEPVELVFDAAFPQSHPPNDGVNGQHRLADVVSGRQAISVSL